MSANVALSDTFDQWRVKSNELLVMTQGDGSSNFIKLNSTTNSTSNTTGSIITAGGIGVAKSVVVGENLNVHGNIHANGNISADGSITLGDANTDNVVFNADINSSLIPNSNGAFDIGNSTMYWSNGFFESVKLSQASDLGMPALQIDSDDADQAAFTIDAEQTTTAVMRIDADSLETNSAIYISDNSASTSARSSAFILQDNSAALAATALRVESDGGVTGMTIDKNFTDINPATVTGLHVDFDRPVPSSGTSDFTDIGINLDLNSAGLGTTTTTGLDIDVVGATSGTHTATGININVSGADSNYALVTAGGNVGIGTANPASLLHVSGQMQVGVDDDGYDVIFYGDGTDTNMMMWDASADELLLSADSKLSFHDAAGGENIQASSDGVLGINAGTSLTLTAPTVIIADGTNDLNIASHDGSNGLKLAGTLVTVDANHINTTTGKAVAFGLVFGA